MDNKLTQSDLDELREANLRFNSLKMELADNIISRRRLSDRQSEIMREIPDAENSLSNIEKRIKEQYAAVRINMTTGAVNEPE